MNALVVIPARWGSTRFPGKPLATIAGVSMIERTWRIARQSAAGDVVVATDDERIRAHVEAFGGRVQMTREDCANGTERVHDALTRLDLDPDVVLNLQGDAVLTPPWILDDLIACLGAEPGLEIATPAVRMSWPHYDDFVARRQQGKAGGTTVTFDANGDALYFSKSVIPFVREREGEDSPVFRHVGLYAFRPDALERYLALPPGRFEQVEKLEQLRALENGMAVRVVEVDYRGRAHWSVDNPEDVAVVEQLLRDLA